MAQHSIKVHYLLSSCNPSSGLPEVEYSQSTSLSQIQLNPDWGMHHAKELFRSGKIPLFASPVPGGKIPLILTNSVQGESRKKGKEITFSKPNWLFGIDTQFFISDVIQKNTEADSPKIHIPLLCVGIRIYTGTYTQTCKLHICHGRTEHGCAYTHTVVILREESYVASPKGI